MQSRLISLLAVLLCCAGCTAQNWYDGFQQQRRNECQKYQQQYEVQRCLERVNGMSYDQFRNERDQLKAKE